MPQYVEAQKIKLLNTSYSWLFCPSDQLNALLLFYVQQPKHKLFKHESKVMFTNCTHTADGSTKHKTSAH